MFSVEDLLISHGYKLSKNPPAPYDNRCDGYQHELTENRPGHTTLNGFETDSGAYVYKKKPLAKGYLSDNEGSHGIQRKQTGHTYLRDLQGSDSSHISEVGFCDRPPLAWSSRPKTDKDLAYWRRRGQDFSVLLGYANKRDSELKGMATLHPAYRPGKESQQEVGAGTENVGRSSLQESWKMPGDYKWQSLKTGSWKQPKMLGRQMSDGDREKLLQDLYSLTLGEDALSSHNKGKSQSLPRVLSPESLRCVEMPSLINNSHLLSGTKAPSCPPNRQTLESCKHPEAGAQFLPLSKPKYGRPLKPPSYELHRQTRGTTETNTFQENQQKDEAASYLTKVNEQKQDIYIQDPSLEPPVYVPPPSYKSPPQQNMNHLLSEVPDYDVCFNNNQQHPAERTTSSYQLSTGTLEAEDENCKDEQLSCDKRSYTRHAEDYLSSVQYIPFDDPRIRHIQIAPPETLQNHNRHTGNMYRASPSTSQAGALELKYSSAFPDTSDLFGTVKGQKTPDSSAHSNKWLAASNGDRDNCALPDQRDSCDENARIPDPEMYPEYPKGKLSVRNPHMESTCETVTKVKKFEPGTEIQSKRSSKKKTNETIFCLVSIPVKSESNLPDTDGNNNLTQAIGKKNGFDNSGALKEQSLLSMSSTDLELQALTGSMTNKNELQKQELWRPEEFKQMNDLRLIQPTKHRELKYSGSWPGDQYRDQQTQTSFTAEPKRSQLFYGSKPGGANKLMTPKFLGCATPMAGSKGSALLPDDGKCRQNSYSMKGQMYLSPSSNSAFSRAATSLVEVHSPKTCQKQPCEACTSIPAQEREASTVPKGEVIKGEAGAPCNSKELFGQFLLKPVSRRPWDAISELESFNKELQEHEESSCSSEEGVENEGKQWQDCAPTETGTCRTGGKPEIAVPKVPVFKQGRVKSKSESWSLGVESSDSYTYAGSQISLRAKENSKADERVIAEMRKQEPGNGMSQQLIISGPIKRGLSSSPDNATQTNPFNCIDFRETNGGRDHIDNILGFENRNKSAASRSDKALERGSQVRLSLANRNQGLSEPDLRSVGLDIGSELGASKLDYSQEVNTAEIPPNESLQARAARILGIEVAVESLIPANRSGLHQHTNYTNDTPDLELPGRTTLGDKIERKNTSYESRRKCGWTESSLFVGDFSLGSLEYPSNLRTNQEATSKTLVSDSEQGFEQPKGLHRQNEDQNPPCRSVTLQLAERNITIPSSEKRIRSTSKVIEKLQGKLASPPSRAVMDRMVRMKEVDSVSRMRRLSIKSADLGEEVDEEKPMRGTEEKGNYASLGGNELPRKIAHGGAVSKRIISLDENGPLNSISERRADRNLFCLGKWPYEVKKSRLLLMTLF
uniref:Junctional cadherin 5 associated n=1 Tax=Sphenodon punctatus TaxID=8508 RepID=A0A8D0HPL9_SPHPU